MRAELERIERITSYVLNEMPGSQRLDFESELALHPDLREEVNIYTTLIRAVQADPIDAAIRKAERSYLLRRRIKYATAVLIAVATIATVCWFLVNRNNDVTTPTRTSPHGTINVIQNAAGANAADSLQEFADTVKATKEKTINTVTRMHAGSEDKNNSSLPPATVPLVIANVDSVKNDAPVLTDSIPLPSVNADTSGGSDKLPKSRPKRNKKKPEKTPLPEYDLKRYDKNWKLKEGKK